MRTDAEGKSHEHEDEGGDGQGEALVKLHVEGGSDLSLALEGGDGDEQRPERELAFRLVLLRRRREGRVHGQVHVVEAEGGVTEAARVTDAGLVDGAVDEAQRDAPVLLV